MTVAWWHYVLWIVAAGGLGFAQTFILADKLRLTRRRFLVFYVPITAVFLYGYARWAGLDLQTASTANLGIAAVLAVLGGAFLVTNVLSQPASPRSQGVQLAGDVIWIGGIYGVLDALLLSVLPIHATKEALALLGLGNSLAVDLMTGVVAFVASVLVTVAYHIGYPEFRGRKSIIAPVIGNSICSLVYLLSGNLLAPVLAHIAMHVAAVFHGPETTVQLPPHYSDKAI